MPRQITDHRYPGLNDRLYIQALDEPGANTGNDLYRIEYGGGIDHGVELPGGVVSINFQDGPLGEAPNGVSNEAVLAVVLDRLRGYQAGKFACRENAIAITKIEEAIMWLQKRTRGREARGVEGMSTP